jgi:hypothetical protein
MTDKELAAIRLHWTKTIKALCSYGFSQFLNNRTEAEFKLWENSSYEDLGNISYFHGVTKLVIVDEDNDWVLKIPFSNKACDYCALEAENYKKAVEAGVEEGFAACYFLMEYEGAPCYIMEKVICDEEVVESDFYEIGSNKLSSEMDEDEIYSYLGSMDSYEIVDQLLEFYYDEGFLGDIYNFLSENEINDLHTGNVGYRGTNLVFVDYSGY